jgi:glutamate-1-semialdehyde 2,1-aminomutase
VVLFIPTHAHRLEDDEEGMMTETDYMAQYTARTPLSEGLSQRARKVMPGGVSHRYRHISPHPFFIKRANGSKFWDVDGHEYVDLWMGHFALILGHRHPVVNQAVAEVADLGTHWGIVHEYEIQFAELIQEIVPCAEKLVFGVSGTEATMYAVRLARGFTDRRIILKVAGGWHGANPELAWTIRSPFDQPESSGLIQEMGLYTKPISFNDVESTLKTIHEFKEDLAGIIVEPVMGAGGMVAADQGYLEMLREETDRLGAVLIFDEIITGFRLSLGGAQAVYGVTPDLVTLGKVAGGGTNIGIVAGKADIFALCDPTIPRKKGESVMVGGGTFSCSPMSMVVGSRVVQYLKSNEKDVYPRIDGLGQRLRQGMADAFGKHGVAAKTTGTGSLCGVYFPYDAETVARRPEQMHELTDLQKLDHEFRIRMLNHGVFVMHGGGAVSVAHTEEDIDRVIAAVEEVAKELAESA